LHTDTESVDESFMRLKRFLEEKDIL